MKIIAALLILATALPSFAAEKDDYKYCTSAGYWLGAGDAFMGQLAAHIAGNRGLMSDPVCMSAWRSASEVGQRAVKSGITKSDMPLVLQASEMSNKVYDYIETAADL